MNIYEKLLNITNEIGIINKNLTVGEGKSKYKAVGEADVLKAVKELENKHKIYSYPKERRIVESSVLQTEKTYNGETKKSQQNFLRIETIYRFVNIENTDEFIDITTYGDGVDTQDKAPGKAMTYSDKYALLKAYKIVTGDDPDQEASPENVEITSKIKKLNKVEEVSKVTEVEAKSIYSFMIRKGLDVVPLLQKNYGISNTSELNKEQYISILNKIKNMPDKEAFDPNDKHNYDGEP